MSALRSWLCCCLAALAFSGAGLAGELTGAWTGKYMYPEDSNRDPVTFRLMLVHEGQDVFGFIKEANTFGEQGVPWLHAVVKGRFDKTSGELQFTKSYDGTAGQHHDVAYRGLWDQESGKVQGTWKIPGEWGATFRMERAPRQDAEPSALEGVWAGSYHYPETNDRAPVKFWMIVVEANREFTGFVKEPNTFGKGNDPWLHAVLKGPYDRRAREVMFIKTYDGTSDIDHDVTYRGRMAGEATELTGTWQIKEDWGGKFSARKLTPREWGTLRLNVPMKIEKSANTP